MEKYDFSKMKERTLENPDDSNDWVVGFKHRDGEEVDLKDLMYSVREYFISSGQEYRLREVMVFAEKNDIEYREKKEDEFRCAIDRLCNKRGLLSLIGDCTALDESGRPTALIEIKSLLESKLSREEISELAQRGIDNLNKTIEHYKLIDAKHFIHLIFYYMLKKEKEVFEEYLS